MTTKMCAGCGVDVPGQDATFVESTTVAGTSIRSIVCPACASAIREGKHPRVSMGADGKLEAVPSVPAEPVVRACTRCVKKAYVDGDKDCAACDWERIEQARRLREMGHDQTGSVDTEWLNAVRKNLDDITDRLYRLKQVVEMNWLASQRMDAARRQDAEMGQREKP